MHWHTSIRVRSPALTHHSFLSFLSSNALFTDSPVCAASSVTIVGASIEESISVPCRVNADPPDVEFEWSFSSSGERFEVPHGHYTTVQDNGNGASAAAAAAAAAAANGFIDSAKSTSTMDSSEMHTDNEGMCARRWVSVWCAGQLMADTRTLNIEFVVEFNFYIHFSSK